MHIKYIQKQYFLQGIRRIPAVLFSFFFPDFSGLRPGSESDARDPQDLAPLQEKLCHGHVPAEPGAAAAAGIQPEPAVDPFLAVLMGMAADDSPDPARIGRDAPAVMGHQKRNARDFEPKNAGQVTQAGLPPVVIALYGVNGTIQAQLVQIGFLHDIARVKNMGAVLQRRDDLPPQQAVGIGEDGHGDRLIPVFRTIVFHAFFLFRSSPAVRRMIPDYTGTRAGCKGKAGIRKERAVPLKREGFLDRKPDSGHTAGKEETGGNRAMKPVLIVILAALLILNLISFFLMAHDKQCARKGKRRIPEKTLFLSAGLFGALGGTAGMWLCRHKTKHWYFRVFFPVMLFVQAAVLAYVMTRYLL